MGEEGRERQGCGSGLERDRRLPSQSHLHADGPGPRDKVGDFVERGLPRNLGEVSQEASSLRLEERAEEVGGIEGLLPKRSDVDATNLRVGVNGAAPSTSRMANRRAEPGS
eukprot:scaffold191122_cov18-Tisochrysis_lutea.AAC.1